MTLSPSERREIYRMLIRAAGTGTRYEGQLPTICYNCQEPLAHTPDGHYCPRCASDDREFPHPSY